MSDSHVILANSPNFPDAACTTSGFLPDTWFPESNRDPEAKEQQIELTSAFCKQCRHQFECLDFARSEGIKDGIWGGILVSEMPAIIGRNEKSVRQSKLNQVREAVSNGWSLQDACSDAGISEKTYYRYLNYEKTGWPTNRNGKERK